jgi:two-component system nitrate/nitrite response regulator NarL
VLECFLSTFEGQVRILIADDLEAIRRQVSLILTSRPELEVCAEAENGKEAVEKSRELQPDLIILDITMPILNGLDAARRIRTFAPETPILILTVHKSRQLMEEAKKIGVRGYVTKGDAGEKLLDAVDAVTNSQSYFPSEV